MLRCRSNVNLLNTGLLTRQVISNSSMYDVGASFLLSRAKRDGTRPGREQCCQQSLGGILRNVI